ncbi:hypothetical protein DOTSEDRAFT_74737 [Dothistroma septosporum NZE10]|uniref:CCR4-Not complex 3'-5'-exoribonuclease subunit Ccr4 n=1 Tax=Dothistroma septosporum (strain NZE10 / CBS 128990) TaxID=675120 RepID=N1PC34_DOTSN|nr:hypothetical protein DOTSEDRAFT_74737 [Dothistroma septosporum NZE10]
MADGFNRFNTGGQQYYYQNNHTSHPRGQLHHRNGSPINNNRGLFNPNADTPSPNRSPGTNSPAHNAYSMYNNHNHRQNHSLLNGGAAHQNFQPQVNLGQAFAKNVSHAHQNHHLNNQHNDHSALHNTFGNHQHTISNSTLSHTTPQFTPAHLQNGTPDHSTSIEPANEHWAEQLREYNKLRMAEQKVHWYARTAGSMHRFPGVSSAGNNEHSQSEEHGERRRIADESDDMGSWDCMDLCGQGLKAMAPALFIHYPKLKKVYLNWNKIRSIPPQIGQMRFLTVLDLSNNDLHWLPPEIGVLTNLKKLNLYDNNLDDLPYELGSLYQLEMLGLEGNPMRPDYKEILIQKGTKEMIRTLRETAPKPDPPMDRPWRTLVEDTSEGADTFKLLSWNILCDRSATESQFGYTPKEALAWPRRKFMILDEMTGRNPDVMCIQEMDGENYNDFFRPQLAAYDYKAVFTPKSRAQTMAEKEAKSVDGSAIFFKNSKYILLDKQVINFSREAISRPDMKGEHDVYNRVMPRDHVAIVAFLENRATGSRMIVANTHLTWQPEHSDIKIVQIAIMMDYINKMSNEYAKWPACKDKELYKYNDADNLDGADGEKPQYAPSMKYDEPTQLPLLVCGDFNSTKDSGVYELIAQGSLSNAHSELGTNKYGDFTRHGMSHPFSLKSAYGNIGELPFTNYTPDFRQVIDWVFYTTNTMQVLGLLDRVDTEYMRRVPGFPNHYFPSDHLPLMIEFQVKERKERKVTETDFGNSRRESRN